MNDVMHRVQNHICKMWFIKQKLKPNEKMPKPNKTKQNKKTTSNRYFDIVSFRKQTKNRFSTYKQKKVISTEERGKKKQLHICLFFFQLNVCILHTWRRIVCGCYRNFCLLCPTASFFFHLAQNLIFHILATLLFINCMGIRFQNGKY